MRLSSTLIVLAFTLAPGCVIPLDVGDGGDADGDGGLSSSEGSTSGETSTTSASTGETGTGGETDAETDADDETTAGPMGVCASTPDFQCSEGIDCSGGGCGDPFSQFDEDGCLRPFCGPGGECGPGQTCFTPQDFGGCASSGVFCAEEGDACLCSGNPDCGGSYCVPEDEVPSASCDAQPDETSCLAAGCSHFETVTEINPDCSCVTGQPACLWFTGGIGGSAAPEYFWHEQTQTVALFSTGWAELPVGWRSCADGGAPAACGCYGPLDEPMCP